MKILVDECAPRALKLSLAAEGHECLTVQEAGWAGRSNGELLSLAETVFEVLITLDTNLSYQQNFGGRRIAVNCYRCGIKPPRSTESPLPSLR
jgi:predicted nuclease of predicted toxin-antitoxin system